ncbi:MAG: hypothetical protein ACTHK2_04830 [Dokdonella sp.]|uniref:hypothetical protein n=1 Tax=Dokdonella sp. TaxID=2291710 RepID=UPI003F7EDDEE
MQTLKICDVGLRSDTSHAFHSMLKIVAGRSKAAWQLAGIEHADVLFASCEGDGSVFTAWGASGKPVVLVIDDRSSWPPAPFVLRHPFRVMQLLSVLDDVAELMAAAPGRERSDRGRWSGAESLRVLMPQSGNASWHVARTPLGEEAWLGHGHVCVDARTIARLRAGGLELAAFQPAATSPPPDAVRIAACDFAWYVGLKGPASLAPWLAADAAYRLRRWPDLGRLGASTGLLELSAMSTVRAWTPPALVEASGQAEADVHRFLAAASIAGLLVVANGNEQVSARPARGVVQSGWNRFLGGLRRHLGLAA